MNEERKVFVRSSHKKQAQQLKQIPQPFVENPIIGKKNFELPIDENEPFRLSMQRMMAPILPSESANNRSMNSEMSPNLQKVKNILDTNLQESNDNQYNNADQSEDFLNDWNEFFDKEAVPI